MEESILVEAPNIAMFASTECFWIMQAILALRKINWNQTNAASRPNNTPVYSIKLELQNAPIGEKIFLQKYIRIKQVAIDSLLVGSNTELVFHGHKSLEEGM